jgi:hypothetical protein
MSNLVELEPCRHYDSNLRRCNFIYGCRNMGRPETEKDIKIYEDCKGHTKKCKNRRTP